MVFVEGDNYRALRRPGDDPARFRAVVRPLQAPEPPDSVVHQYRGENFTTSTWPDTAPSGPQVDMSINGVSASTLNGNRAGLSDGVDDFGLTNNSTDGPQNLAENKTLGVALTFKSSEIPGGRKFGAEDRSDVFEILTTDFFTGTQGSINFRVRDGARGLAEGTTTNFNDGVPHLVCINKTANTGSGAVDIYVDDMSTPTSSTTGRDQGFDHSDYNVNQESAFYAGTKDGSIGTFEASTISFFEFNAEPYSQQDRLELKQRAPGV
jgi:hypothetical protein